MPRVSVSVCRTPREWLIATRLLSEYLDWLGAASGVGDVTVAQPSAAHELADLSAVYGGRDDAFFLARHGALTVGTVGVRRVADHTVEIARLYVRSRARGTGTGRALVARAVRHARTIGAARIVLDTHGEVMPEAVRLYRSVGFTPTDEPCPIPVAGAVRLELPVAS